MKFGTKGLRTIKKYNAEILKILVHSYQVV